MITGDDIHDALDCLPEELLISADAQRTRKPFPWNPLVAVAVCLCLFTTIWLLAPDYNGPANRNMIFDIMGGAAAERGDGAVAENSTTSINTADLIVITVTSETVIAEPIQYPSADSGETDSITITLDNMEENAPTLSPGQKIRVYYTETTVGSLHIRPYKIESIKEESP